MKLLSSLLTMLALFTALHLNATTSFADDHGDDTECTGEDCDTHDEGAE